MTSLKGDRFRGSNARRRGERASSGVRGSGAGNALTGFPVRPEYAAVTSACGACVSRSRVTAPSSTADIVVVVVAVAVVVAVVVVVVVVDVFVLLS